MEHLERYKLALYTIISGFIIILIFSILSFYGIADLEAKEVLNAVLPLIATWIGAIIAFYFGRENFEAAQNQIKNFLNSDTLDDIPVKNIMIHTSTMVVQKVEKQKPLQEYRAFLETVNKSRLPLINDSAQIEYIIHKSEIDNAIIIDNNITLDTFLKSNKASGNYGYNQLKGFVTISPDTKLEVAIEKMKNLQSCNDIFVTNTGNDKGTLLGWITDTLAYNFLKVHN